MKTKSVLKFLVPVAISALLVSCSSNNKVASNFGKRKYTKGFFFDRPAKPDAPARNTASVLPKSSHAVSTSSSTLQNTTTTTPVVVMQDKKLSVSTNNTVASTPAKKHSFANAVREAFSNVSGKTAVASSSSPKIGSPSSLDNEGGYHSSGGGGGGSCKSWIVCLLLCWLLGEIGVHRFYMGYIWQGVVQLLTAGGCGIWTLIDFIRIIMKTLKPKDGDYC